MKKEAAAETNRDPLFRFTAEYSVIKERTTPSFSNNAIVFLKRGKIHLRGDKLQIIPPGNVISIPQQKGDRISIAPDSDIIQFQFSQSFLEQIDISLRDDAVFNFFDFHLHPDKRELIQISVPPEKQLNLETISRNIIKENSGQESAYRVLLLSKFIELLVLLFRAGIPEESHIKTGAAVWKMEDVITYIQDNYTQNLSLDEIADRCALNRSYFSRAFHNAAGMPLFEFINRIRVRKSCILLKRTNQSIIDIAFATGYNNISFFNRYFKKIMKISPREYRNRAKK